MIRKPTTRAASRRMVETVTSRLDLVERRKVAMGAWIVVYRPHQGAQEIARRQARGF